MRILHLSDCHLPRERGPDADGVDARVVLERLRHDCRHLPEVDLVVVSGDIADDGSPEGYRDARAMVGSFAQERGVPAVSAPATTTTATPSRPPWAAATWTPAVATPAACWGTGAVN